MANRKMPTTRRSIVKGLGVASMGAVAPFVSTARGGSEQRVGAGEIGIAKSVNNLLRKRRYEKAKVLMEKHDVNHEISAKQIQYTANSKVSRRVGLDAVSKSKKDQDDQVTTHDNYTGVDLTRATYLISSDDNEWSTDMNWDLTGDPQNNSDCAASDDGVGITLNPDNWNINSGSDNWDDRSSLDKRGDKGRIVGFNDSDYGIQDWETGFMSYSVWRTESDFPATLYGTYTHTWDICGTGGSATFGLAVGPITVTTTLSADSWQERLDHEVQPDGTVQEVTY